MRVTMMICMNIHMASRSIIRLFPGQISPSADRSIKSVAFEFNAKITYLLSPQQLLQVSIGSGPRPTFSSGLGLVRTGSRLTAFTTAQMNPLSGQKEPEFVLTEPNRLCVKAH